MLHGVLFSVAVASSGLSQVRADIAAPSAAYAISYVEVKASSEATTIAALREYREASRKDEGCIRIELLEQVGRPGHFATIETWTNQGALDAHETALSTKHLLEKLEPVRSSDYDRRAYKTLTLTVAPRSAAAGIQSIVVVVSHVDTLPIPQTDAPGLLKRLAEMSRGDEGNIRFDVVQHATRANHFTVIETWRNTKALQAHAEAAHTRQYRDNLKTMAGSPLDERLYKAIQ
jgi:quinol monooxygenase YgiN